MTTKQKQGPPGWYTHPDKPNEEWYWDGNAWTESRRRPETEAKQSAPPAGPREGYLINARMRVASRVAVIAAVLCMFGLLGGLASGTDASKKTAFDLGRKESGFEIKAYRPGPGYIAGPILILITIVPLAWRKSPEGRWVSSSVLYKDEYRVRLGIATALWLGGLVLAAILTAVISSDGYTIESGTYIALTLVSAGLVASLAMWPFGARAVRVDEEGKVSEVAGGGVGAPRAT